MAKVSRGGRPQKKLKVVKKVMAEQVLASIDELKLWQELLSAERTVVTKTGSFDVPDWSTRLDALKYLTDRRDGKAPQAITGPDGGPQVFELRILGARNKSEDTKHGG